MEHKKYLKLIGSKGGKAGTGKAKARSHAQCVKAGKAGAAVRWGKRNKETGGK